MARILVTSRGGGALLEELRAPDGAVVSRSELPLPDDLACGLATSLARGCRPDAAVLVHRDPTLFTVGVVATGGGLVAPDDLVEELGWFGVDATLVAPLDDLHRHVREAGVATVVGLVVPADDAALSVRATQLVLDSVVASVPRSAQRRRRPLPPVHGRRCRTLARHD